MNYEIVEFDPYLAIQVDSEWFSEPLDSNYPKNRFITLQLFSMKGSLNERKFILENPEWSEDNPDNSGHLSSWKGETALPIILDCLYSCLGRFREELFSEEDLGQNFPRYFHLEVHLFYSYSDLVAIMGRRLSTFSVDLKTVG